MTTATLSSAAATTPAATRRRRRSRGWIFHAVMTPVSILWVLPIVFVIMVAFRSYDDIAAIGLGTRPQSFTLDGFRTAWVDGNLSGALVNSLIVTVCTVIIVLFLASLSAFALSRYRIPFGRGILLIMLAGNLLPPQI